jgi:hypothetical protein
VANPDVVTVKAQHDALTDQRDRRAVEVAAQLEVAVQRNANGPRAAEIKRRWRQ